MRILGNISGKQAVKAFASAGWKIRGQVGSHIILTKPDPKVNLSIPQHREQLGPGLLRSLVRNAGLTMREEGSDPAGATSDGKYRTLPVRYPTNFSTETPNNFAKASATALLIGRFPDSIADM